MSGKSLVNLWDGEVKVWLMGGWTGRFGRSRGCGVSVFGEVQGFPWAVLLKGNVWAVSIGERYTRWRVDRLSRGGEHDKAPQGWRQEQRL